MELTQRLISDIYESRGNLLTMIEDRGFNIDSYKNFTMNEITIQYNSHSAKIQETPEVGPLDILVKNGTSKLMVKYILSKAKKTPKTDILVNDIMTNVLSKTDTLILMFSEPVLFKKSKENKVEEYVQYYWVQYGYFVQMFGLQNLLFNISKNIYVPKHEVLSSADTKKMIKEHSISTVKDLPTIRREDPMAKYIGLRPGQICKITYPSLASGYSVKYRRCTHT
jgi:DNA-directed RNA polymerase subunit H (RpoH/RPB5)